MTLSFSLLYPSSFSGRMRNTTPMGATPEANKVAKCCPLERTAASPSMAPLPNNGVPCLVVGEDGAVVDWEEVVVVVAVVVVEGGGGGIVVAVVVAVAVAVVVAVAVAVMVAAVVAVMVAAVVAVVAPPWVDGENETDTFRRVDFNADFNGIVGPSAGAASFWCC
jgi:hypothetical protein